VAKAAITLPKADRLLLILLHSSRRFPLAPETLTLSDPARSIKLSFPIFIYFRQFYVKHSLGSIVLIYSTIIIKTA